MKNWASMYEAVFSGVLINRLKVKKRFYLSNYLGNAKGSDWRIVQKI